MALMKLEGAIVLSSSTVVGTFAGSSVSISADTWYLNSPGYSYGTSFLQEFKAQLDAATGRTWTVTCDDDSDTSTGKITISCTGGATTATWSSTSIRNALGFTGNLGSGTTWTGDNQAKYLWLPNCGRSGVLGPDASNGAIEADYSFAMGTDGTPYVLSYNTRYKDTLELRTVLGSKTWTTHEVTVNESFETYYGSVIAYGLRT